jgi:cell division protein FtsW
VIPVGTQTWRARSRPAPAPVPPQVTARRLPSNGEAGAVPRADRVLLGLTLALVGIGIVWVYSASTMLAVSYHETSLTFLLRQGKNALFGLLCLGIGARVDYHRYAKRWRPILGGAVILLVLTVFIGHTAGGSKRWLGPFQPVEVARIATYIALARILSQQRASDRESFVRGVLPALALTGVVAVLLVLQPNLGSTIALVAVLGVLLVAAGARYRHLALVAIAAAVLAFVVISMNPYMHRRVASFGGSHDDLRTAGWQLHQSLVALGSGGLVGRGFGASLQKLYFLPDPHTDFILAIIGEEKGLLGTASVLLLLIGLVARGIRAARTAREPFGYYLGLALSSGIAVYTALNTAVVTGLIPTTGLPLPFISYGGSALTMNMFAVGVLLNISYQGMRRTSQRAVVRTGAEQGARAA